MHRRFLLVLALNVPLIPACDDRRGSDPNAGTPAVKENAKQPADPPAKTTASAAKPPAPTPAAPPIANPPAAAPPPPATPKTAEAPPPVVAPPVPTATAKEPPPALKAYADAFAKVWAQPAGARRGKAGCKALVKLSDIAEKIGDRPAFIDEETWLDLYPSIANLGELGADCDEDAFDYGERHAISLHDSLEKFIALYE